jgi:hypothetical protein
MSPEFCTVFLDALHQNVPALDCYPDGIEATDIMNGFGQRTSSFDGLGDGEVLQFIINERDIIMLR